MPKHRNIFLSNFSIHSCLQGCYDSKFMGCKLFRKFYSKLFFVQQYGLTGLLYSIEKIL